MHPKRDNTAIRRLPTALHLLLFAMLFSFNGAHAQSRSTEGKDFWLSYMGNSTSTTSTLGLIVTGQRACTGRVENPNTGWSTTFSVAAQTVTTVSIPVAQGYSPNTSLGIYNKGLHVTTTDTVSLYASNYMSATFDVSNVLPTPSLRNDYIIQAYTNSGALTNSISGFLIVATQDNTEIDILPSATPYGRSNTSPYTITLNRGQIYQMGTRLGNKNMAGTRITARDCKPIAVFGGNTSAQIPVGTRYADHIIEQIMPVSFLGQHFIATATMLRTYDRVLITAADNNCEVRINGSLVATLNAYQTHEYVLTESTKTAYIETTTPAEVYLYITSTETDNTGVGDPSMILVAPIEQQMSKVTFGTFQTTNVNRHYVNVITPTSTVSSMRLDAASIAGQFSTVSGNPAYSYARIQVTNGSHTLENTNGGFVAHVYGIGNVESYGYSVGSSLHDLTTRIVVNEIEYSDSLHTSACVGQEVPMRVVSDYALANVDWLFGDGTTDTGISTTHAYSIDGHYKIKAALTFVSNDCELAQLDTIEADLHIIAAAISQADSLICDGSGIVWNGELRDSTGVYVARFASSEGCDSVARLNLTVSRSTETAIDEFVPAHELPHTFGGHTFYGAADTTLHFTNVAGCDSAIHYTLSVNTVIRLDTAVCQNSLPLLWHGASFSSDGSQNIELPGDTTLTLTVRVKRNSGYTQHDTVVENALPVNFAGISFVRAQRDTTMTRVNAAGCDSLITYSLHVWPNITTSIDTALCENLLPLTWNGIVFTDDETRQATLTGQHGEDSTVVMTARILRNTFASRHDTIVQNLLPHRYEGLSFDAPQADTLLVRANAAGCDSLITYSLHVWPNLFGTADSTICDNSLPLTWNGATFATPYDTMQTAVLTAMHGEDSTVEMRLHTLRTSSSTRRDTVVENQTPILFAGLKFEQSQPDTLIVRTNAAGCDSLIHYSLHVWPNLAASADSTLCEAYLPLVWNGISFTNDSAATVTLAAQHGEDSVLTMYVYISRNTTSSIADTTVENNLPVSIAGHSFYNEQRDTLLHIANAAGCDSLIHYSLHVWRNIFVKIDTMVCQHELPYRWEPFTFAAAGSQTATLTAAGSHGEDSTITKSLGTHPDYNISAIDSVSDTNLPFYYLNRQYNYTTYNDTFHLASQHGCDSLVSFSLVVVYHRAECDLYLQFPNLVSANGDGVNDRFEIVNLIENDCYEHNELMIYNRWGRLVFSVKNIRDASEYWDPAAEGALPGTYYYVFVGRGVQGSVRRSGVIEVIR